MSDYSIGGYSIEDLAGMTTDELNAILEKEWADLSEDELEEAKTALDEEISAYKDELENAADELEDAVDGIDDDAERADAEKLLSEVEAELENADALEDAVSDEYIDIQEHKVDLTDGSDMSISELDLDGGTYTYSMSGGSTNPFEGTSTVSGDYTNSVLNGVVSEEDYQYLLDEGIIDESGVVINDADTVDGLNYGDIEYALEQKRLADLGEAQAININTGSDEYWTLVSSDNGTYTFKVEDSSTDPPTYAYVTFENAANVVFYFSSGITEADFETMKTAWPTDLLKNCYWGDSTTSFYDELFPDETDDEAVLEVIDGYAEASASYSDARTALTTSGISDTNEAAANAALEEVYTEAIDLLYEYLDDPTKDLQDIWNEILALCASNGFSAQDISDLIKTLVVGLSSADPDHLATFIPPTMVTTLETYIQNGMQAEDLNEQDKLVIMILESKCGPGLYAVVSGSFWTSGHFSTDGVAEGDWKSQPENIWALEQYNTLFPGDASATISLTNEEAIQEGEVKAETEGSATLDEWKNIDDKLYYDNDGWQGSDIKKGEWQFFLDALGNSMFDENGNLKSGDDLWEAIESAMEYRGTKLNEGDQDAILSNLCVLIGDHASDDFIKAFFGAVGGKIKTFLKNSGGTKADNQNKAIDLIDENT